MEKYKDLIMELCNEPVESQWVEFKTNNSNPTMIGEAISALANGAAMLGKQYAYMIWGVDDKTHEIVGTNFDLSQEKKGNQELENWLRGMLSKNADFKFVSVPMNNKNVGILIIYKAVNQTVTFERTDYIRVGSYTKKLNEFPELESRLWNEIRNSKFEEQYAQQDLTAEQILLKLDCDKYFNLKKDAIPSNIENVIHYLLEEKIIVRQDNGRYAITNMGAILFSRNLNDFSKLSRKCIRVVQYKANNRIDMLKDKEITTGYAVGFENLLEYIDALLPSEEVIENGLRIKKYTYPPIAIREAVANALIHQDFSITGTGVVIEIFDKRIEITNPGVPLIDVNRIIDNPPRSRNEKLASLMRRLKMCEELGTGWDKIVISCELEQLPAPHIDIYEENTKVTLLSYTSFFDLPQSEKLISCYMHSCIQYVKNDFMTNSTLRERFGLKETSSASISRLIKDACSKKLIKKLEDTAPRYTKYVPYWA